MNNQDHSLQAINIANLNVLSNNFSSSSSSSRNKGVVESESSSCRRRNSFPNQATAIDSNSSNAAVVTSSLSRSQPPSFFLDSNVGQGLLQLGGSMGSEGIGSSFRSYPSLELISSNRSPKVSYKVETEKGVTLYGGGNVVYTGKDGDGGEEEEDSMDEEEKQLQQELIQAKRRLKKQQDLREYLLIKQLSKSTRGSSLLKLDVRAIF